MLILQRPIQIHAARIVSGILITTVCVLASNPPAQNPPAARTAIAQLAVASLGEAEPSADPQYSLTFTLKPRVKTFVYALAEYNASTCVEVSSGTWSVTTAPNYGKTSTGTVTGPAGNGACPGVTFTFGAIYYTWTSKDPAGVSSDSFAATWTSPEYTVPETVGITLIVPVNYTQNGPGVAKPGGVLHFNYTWASTSGNLADLSQCKVGENVTYPGTANPYLWPSPPYQPSSPRISPNPTVNWVAATAGKGQDNHYHNTFLTPYVANAFNASQEYRYQCRNLDTLNFPGWSGIAIARTVADSTGRGCWGYTVTKSGASASVNPLPNVPPANCAPPANYVADYEPQQSMADSNGSGGRIGLSVALPEASFGLGEPIFFELTAVNRSGGTASLDFGLNKKANLELAIRKPGGGVVTRRLSGEGFGAVGEVTLPPDGKFVQTLLLNEWYGFRQTGTYLVKVTLLDGSSANGGTGAAGRPSAEFSVEIGPRDPAKLVRIAQKLADQAIGAATLVESMDAANALSYIRDPVAVASLARVLQKGSLVEQYAIDGLGRIGNPEAIDALEAAESHPDPEVGAAARRMLEELQARPKDIR